MLSGQVQGHRRKKAWNLVPPPRLWQTWHNLAATAVTTSPFQSFMVCLWYEAIPGVTQGAAGRLVQSSNCWSATRRSAVRTSNFRSADRWNQIKSNQIYFSVVDRVMTCNIIVSPFLAISGVCLLRRLLACSHVLSSAVFIQFYLGYIPRRPF